MAASKSKDKTASSQTSHILHIYIIHMIHIVHICFIDHHHKLKSSYNIITDCITQYWKPLILSKFISQGLVRKQIATERGTTFYHNSLWRVGLLASRVITGLTRHGELDCPPCKRSGTTRCGELGSRAMKVILVVASCLARLGERWIAGYGFCEILTKSPKFHHINHQNSLKHRHYVYSMFCTQFLHLFHGFTPSIH